MTRGLGERILSVREGEWGRTLLAGAFFFFILFGYFLLRPAREALGVEQGMDTVRTLFFGTLLATLAANPLFAWVVARHPRRVFMPLIMRFFMLNLVGFFVLLTAFGGVVGVWSGYTYFVWLSVFNMFMVMMFWAFMSDRFTLAESKRLYPVIAIGGTVGALTGSAAAWQIAEMVGTPALLLLAVVFLETGLQCARALGGRGAPARPSGAPAELAAEAAEQEPAHTGGAPSGDELIGGTAWAGFVEAMRNPYLLGICGFILLMTILQTLIYFAQLEVVSRLSKDTDTRAGLFAYVNMITQGATLLVQLLVTAKLIRAIGVGKTLAIVPIVIGGGFAALALVPAAAPAVAYKAIVALEAGFKALSRGISRPTRETLFTVVGREDRYKAKAFIDTFVYRFGDVVGLGVDSALRAFTPAIGALAVVAAPGAIAWAGLGIWLGARQARLSKGGRGPGGDGGPRSGDRMTDRTRDPACGDGPIPLEGVNR